MLHENTHNEPERLAAALQGLRAYQHAVRPERPADMPIVARAGRAMLRDYGVPGGGGRPVVIVPSLINGPEVLDLLPDVSLLRWLAGRGLRPLRVEWGVPDPGEHALSIAGHVETMLLPLLESAGPEATLVGYCLGGTMALAAALVRPPAALALIATPWRFGAFGDEARDGIAALWRDARPTAERIGMLPLEVLQAGFWQLDPRRVVDKFVAFGRKTAPAAATDLFVAVEDWANEGPPLTLAAGRDLIVGMFAGDMTGTGRWKVGGRAIDPAALACPVLDIVSTTDRIVPAASAAGPLIPHARRLTLTQGHVGMMIGGHARAMLWEPLAEWLANPHKAAQYVDSLNMSPDP
ncbi:MAG TPA: alpha/beta hydrolase [Sphingomonas sp.]